LRAYSGNRHMLVDPGLWKTCGKTRKESLRRLPVAAEMTVGKRSKANG
jgi:hypothetical protein